MDKSQPTVPSRLTEETLIQAAHTLALHSREFAQILDQLGPPPLWARPPGFPTLLHIILEQQVSLASAKAAFDRLLSVVSPLAPERFLVLDDATLRAIGFSRQKSAYGRHLARAILEKRLDLEALESQDDAAARAELLKIKGIGPWTADIFLLMALGRPDIWPSGDLAIAVAVQKMRKMETRPNPKELDRIGEDWRPWRSDPSPPR